MPQNDLEAFLRPRVSDSVGLIGGAVAETSICTSNNFPGDADTVVHFESLLQGLVLKILMWLGIRNKNNLLNMSKSNKNAISCKKMQNCENKEKLLEGT